MDQVLGIPEVLRSICNELGKKDCLASALTCRALLEPSLDSLWHTVGSFEPFIHCLPVVTYITCAEAETFLFLTPSKKFTRGHLERYLTFYAHRIRHFVTPLLGRPTHRALSTDFLLAVQLLTNNEPGILSPLLRRIDMHHPSHTDKAPKFNLSAFLSLFLGNHVESFSFPPCKGGPIYTASVHANLKRLSPRMKRLRVLESIFIDNVGTYISPYSWDALEVLQLYTISPDLIHLAATLPQLQTLEVYDTSLVHTASQDFPLTPSSAPSPSSFASLRSLLLATKRAGPSECRIFDYLPEQNRDKRSSTPYPNDATQPPSNRSS
ncbi:hypothetical protein NMY22_g11321 [Coprinellus aureogranulatus]|nr:hypothetical protein NMY22_g11321 [Coprinellus aureogranulatus]